MLRMSAFWVISGHFVLQSLGPLYPQKRTSLGRSPFLPRRGTRSSLRTVRGAALLEITEQTPQHCH